MDLTEPLVRGLAERYARLLTRLGDEIGERPLVLPTGEHFPDKFTGDEKSVRRLVKRMQAHAGIDDIPMSAHLVGEEGRTGGGGCGTGACSTPSHGATDEETPRIVEEEDGWRLNVPWGEIAHPVVLTTGLARSLAMIFLLETRGEEERLAEPIDVTIEIAATALGFGVLLLDGSYIYAKSCGGPRVARATRLGPSELGVLTALFAARGKHATRPALKHLEATQKDALAQAIEWFDSNPELVELLRKAPARVAAGEFELRDRTPWLLRVFGKKRPSKDPLEAALAGDASADELDSLIATMPVPAAARAAKPKDPKLDELRSLVDQALSETS
jgi:hypothetical protein